MVANFRLTMAAGVFLVLSLTISQTFAAVTPPPPPATSSNPTSTSTSRPKAPPQPAESHITRIQLDSISENVFLPPEYFFDIQVQDLRNMHEWRVQEYKSGDMKSVILSGQPLPFTKCIYNETSMSGHIIHGVKCKNQTPSSGSFAARCHCWLPPGTDSRSTCRPYVDLHSLVTFLASPNTTWETIAFRTHQVLSGRYDSPHASVEALFLPKGPTHRWVLAEASIKTAGHVFDVPGGDDLKLQYSVLSYSEALDVETIGSEANAAFSPPPGVFCPPLGPTTYRPPPLADQFSFDIETVLEDIQTVSYETLHFDSVEKLVSYRYRPHLHSSTRGGFLFSNLFGAFHKGSDAYRLVHDFEGGIQYTINEMSQNCTVETIPSVAIDAVPLSNHHVQIKHANELLALGSRYLAYWGLRLVRGVVCEVWVGERAQMDGYYSTVEVLFAHPKWTVEVEVLNLEKRVPLGVITHATQNTSSGRFEKVAKSFFFDYSVGHSQWHHFDVTSCLSRISRLFLAVTLKVSYSDLVRYNFDLVLDSIRREIARMAAVSPLRVSDVFLSSGGEKKEVEAYFVLLERPNVTNPPADKQQESLNSAYNVLQDIVTSGHDVSIQVSILPDEKTEVRIKTGSLRIVPDFVHSKFVHAGYTAGSMAGLGFSMALLGVCLGILAGFLTWKRQPGIPYLISD